MLRSLTSSPKIVIALGGTVPRAITIFGELVSDRSINVTHLPEYFEVRSGEIQLNRDLKLILKYHYLFFTCGIPLRQRHKLLISYVSPTLTYTH